ncbi:putative methyltransferase OB1106, partial [Clarias magur]
LLAVHGGILETSGILLHLPRLSLPPPSINQVLVADTHTELSKPRDTREFHSVLQLHSSLQTTQMH